MCSILDSGTSISTEKKRRVGDPYVMYLAAK